MPVINQLLSAARDVVANADCFPDDRRKHSARSIGLRAAQLYICFTQFGPVAANCKVPEFVNWLDQCKQVLTYCQDRLVVPDGLFSTTPGDSISDSVDVDYISLIGHLDRCLSQFTDMCILAGPPTGDVLYQTLKSLSSKLDQLPSSIGRQVQVELKVVREELKLVVVSQKSVLTSLAHELRMTSWNEEQQQAKQSLLQSLDSIHVSELDAVTQVSITKASLERLVAEAKELPEQKRDLLRTTLNATLSKFSDSLSIMLQSLRLRRVRLYQASETILRTCTLLILFLNRISRVRTLLIALLRRPTPAYFTEQFESIRSSVLELDLYNAKREQLFDLFERTQDLVREFTLHYEEDVHSMLDTSPAKDSSDALSQLLDLQALSTALSAAELGLRERVQRESGAEGWFLRAKHLATGEGFQLRDLKGALAACRKAAEWNHVGAQAALADNYGGKGQSSLINLQVSPDSAEELKWLVSAAKLGHKPSRVRLAKKYLQNPLLPIPDDVTGLLPSWLSECAEAGELEAQVLLADLLSGELKSDVFNLPQDDQLAFRWRLLAAMQGDTRSQVLAARYLEATGDPTLAEGAIALRTTAANAGDVESQLVLAATHLFGVGVEKDAEEGQHWAEKCLETSPDHASLYLDMVKDYPSIGVVQRLLDVALKYELGRGLPKHPRLAFALYKALRDEYSSEAIARLGLCYEFAIGTKRDEKEARNMYFSASNTFSGPGKYLWGDCYEHGFGVTQDLEQAFKYFKQAVELPRPFPPSLYRVGRAYEYGLGTEADIDEAMYYYERAAEAGETNAMRRLAEMYTKGIGVHRNEVKARELLVEAQRLEDERNSPNYIPRYTDFWLYTAPRSEYEPHKEKHASSNHNAMRSRMIKSVAFMSLCAVAWYLAGKTKSLVEASTSGSYNYVSSLALVTASTSILLSRWKQRQREGHSFDKPALVEPLVQENDKDGTLDSSQEVLENSAENSVSDSRSDDDEMSTTKLSCVTTAEAALKAAQDIKVDDLLVRNLVQKVALLNATLISVAAKDAQASKLLQVRNYLVHCEEALQAALEFFNSLVGSALTRFFCSPSIETIRKRCSEISDALESCMKEFFSATVLLEDVSGLEALRRLDKSLLEYEGLPSMAQQLQREQAYAQEVLHSTLSLFRTLVHMIRAETNKPILSKLNKLETRFPDTPSGLISMLVEARQLLTASIEDCFVESRERLEAQISLVYESFDRLFYLLHRERLEQGQILNSIDVVEQCFQFLNKNSQSSLGPIHGVRQTLLQLKDDMVSPNRRQRVLTVTNEVFDMMQQVTPSGEDEEQFTSLIALLQRLRETLAIPVTQEPSPEAWLARARLCLETGEAKTHNQDALSACIRAANQGHLTAQLILAENYGGRGHQSDMNLHIATNPLAELRWLSEAALNDHTPSQLRLLLTYAQNEALVLPLRVLSRLIPWAHQLVEVPDPSVEALVLVAEMYEGKITRPGLQVPKDVSVAADLRLEAVEKGHEPSIIVAATQLEQAIDPECCAHAFKLRLKLAEAGDGPSQLSVASAYFLGLGVEPDKSKAEEWISRAFTAQVACSSVHNEVIRASDPDRAVEGETYLQLGKWYEEGGLVPKEPLKAFAWYSRGEDTENAELLYRIGRCHEKGIGVIPNPTSAFEYYTKAHQKGYLDATYHVGRCYDLGIGVASNPKAAQEYYRKASHAGHNDALRNYAKSVLDGRDFAGDPATSHSIYSALAEEGDPEAQVKLGDFYMTGSVVEQDRMEATKWYMKAAEAGNPEGQFRLATCYEKVPELVSTSKAIEWYEKAANQGHARAQLVLATCYEQGKYLAADPEKAFKWCFKAAIQNDRTAQNKLGNFYANGVGVARNQVKAFEWYARAAELGDPQAIFNLGVCYAHGHGVGVNVQRAIQYFAQAAELGVPEAQYNLGVRYETGNGVEKDYHSALTWYNAAAAQGYGRAYYALGQCYAKGIGVAAAPAKAMEMFREAARQGVPEAESYLGYCYETGTHVPKILSEAFKWYSLASQHGHIEAHNNLGLCYEQGWGVERDLYQAFKLYLKAAESGLAQAQVNVASCYESGRGVQQSTSKALEWYTKASAQNDAQALFKLGQLCSQGTDTTQKDLSQAVTYYEKAAELGHRAAQTTLGWLYTIGSGVGADLSKAFAWYSKAAAMNDSHAQSIVGRWCLYGIGIERNEAEGFAWLSKAASRGNYSAMVDLAWCYLNGVATASDPKRAKTWLAKAAEGGYVEAQFYYGWLTSLEQEEVKVPEPENGSADWLSRAAAEGHDAAGWWIQLVQDPRATSKYTIMRKPDETEAERSKKPISCYILGLCYEYGVHVVANLANAYEWYLKAANAGDASAMYRLALFAETGKAGSLNPATAFDLYRKAAEKGHADAQLGVSSCYRLGYGVEKNPAEADLWRAKAVAQGHPKAK